ncbi:MAG: class I SAM-dependent methyltransferase [Lachnospiraceae bacterium]|nr:class I SAM-dependent methyltransferase [Lachnospiraceae bacterium]
MAQQNIYDNDAFFKNFSGQRAEEINFNDVIETPIITAMLPDLTGKRILDIGCGMGQHAKQYAEMGAASVLGIDLSEKMLSFAKENNSSEKITYRRLAFENLEEIRDRFDVITSSLAFDYVQDFAGLMKKIYGLLEDDGRFVYSMSHPISTAYDGVYDRYTRTESGERLYANLHNYSVEGRRVIKWVVDAYELYHRKVSTLINDMAGAGFIIEECQESHLPEEIIRKYPDKFGGLWHQPDFIFFRCSKRQ